MKRYSNTLMGMKENDYGNYCEYTDHLEIINEKYSTIRGLQSFERDNRTLLAINLDLTEQLKQANEALSAITEVIMNDPNGTKKDHLVKKIYGIGDDVSDVNIAMCGDDFTKIDIQKYHSDFAGTKNV